MICSANCIQLFKNVFKKFELPCSTDTGTLHIIVQKISIHQFRSIRTVRYIMSCTMCRWPHARHGYVIREGLFLSTISIAII